MMRAKLITQLIIITPNEVGTLERVCAVIREAGGSLTHMCASTLDEQARFMLNVEPPEPVKEALERMEYEVRTSEVIEVEFENAPGTLEPVAQRLGQADIDIHFMYGTTADGDTVVGILSTNDNQLALNLVNG